MFVKVFFPFSNTQNLCVNDIMCCYQTKNLLEIESTHIMIIMCCYQTNNLLEIKSTHTLFGSFVFLRHHVQNCVLTQEQTIPIVSLACSGFLFVSFLFFEALVLTII